MDDKAVIKDRSGTLDHDTFTHNFPIQLPTIQNGNASAIPITSSKSLIRGRAHTQIVKPENTEV